MRHRAGQALHRCRSEALWKLYTLKIKDNKAFYINNSGISKGFSQH
ncbi:hypothetical protein HMPREF1620_03006 [Escherichia coli 909945-2]|nr:hypothetical protein HMPREF1620_03006 [Escherichia coli 909945-2]